MLTAITLTGDRPDAFRLCERWMRAQSRMPDRWIVTDDGLTPTVTTMGQEVIRLEPIEGNSLTRNLSAALDRVRGGSVVIVEDDDYPAPGYVRAMGELLETAELVGECNATYYHVGRRAYWPMLNYEHASLCSTGFRAHLVPMIQDLCKRGTPFIDVRLWNTGGLTKRLIRAGEKPLVVGIKGMPGRPGTGVGHVKESGGYISDPWMAWLWGAIGPDARAYEGFREH